MKRALLFLIALVPPSCGSRSTHEALPAVVPPALITLLGATGVAANTQADTSVWLRYSAREPYPATRAARALSEQLANSGWTAQRSLYDTAPLGSDPREGAWSYHLQSTPQSAMVDQLFLCWHDRNGNVISYELKYVSTDQSESRGKVQPSNDVLRVRTVYLPARLFRALAEESKRVFPNGP